MRTGNQTRFSAEITTAVRLSTWEDP